MDKLELKEEFGRLAKEYGFERVGGGWVLEHAETLVVLDLQKSNFGDYFDLNVKIYVNGLFGRTYAPSKDLVKKDIGNIFTRQPKEYGSCFSLEEPSLSDAERKLKLRELFERFLSPIAEGCKTKAGILDLGNTGRFFKILPAVYAELMKA
jgi:hypothetical protein